MCAIAAEFFWIDPAGSWTVTHPTDLLGLVLFLGIGGVISGLSEAWRRGTTAVVQSERRLAASDAQLELIMSRTVMDVTDRKCVEIDLRRTAVLEDAIRAERAAKDEAERANQLKDQFLATRSPTNYAHR
jgi:K+-sensing histidine kinase KdpD